VEIKKTLNVNTKLIPGSKGNFDVVADGRLLFSRSETGRFPEPGEITAKLKQEAG